MSYASPTLTFGAAFHAAVIKQQQPGCPLRVEIAGAAYAVERCTATFLIGTTGDGRRHFFNLDRLASVAILED